MRGHIALFFSSLNSTLKATLSNALEALQFEYEFTYISVIPICYTYYHWHVNITRIEWEKIGARHISS